MSEKDVKTKPKASPKTISKETVKKVAVKGKESATSAIKDAKTAMKDAVLKKAVDSKLGTEKETEEPKKVDTEATENVESAVYVTGDVAYRKTKGYVQKKINQHKVKKKENLEKDPEKPPEEIEESPPDEDVKEPKTKENYNKKNNESEIKDKTSEEAKHNAGKKANVKTKEEYLKAQNTDKQTSEKADSVKASRKSYVEKKLKTRAEYERLSAEEHSRISTPTTQKNVKPKQNTELVKRKKTGADKTAKAGKSISGKHTHQKVKTGTSYTGKYAKKKSAKATKTAVKTQKEVTKKAAKETAKQARILAQKAVVVAKKAAILAAKGAVRVAQVVAKAVQALVSAIAALGGGAVLIVILLVVIIVAAIAASPFGIFFSDEATDEKESIPISAIINECNIELSEKLEKIENDNDHDRVELTGEPADWKLVLSLFSVKVAGRDDDEVQDVVVIDESKKQKLKDVFWDMHEITYTTGTVTKDGVTETVLYITIKTKSKEDMIGKYGFSNKQKEALETLLENSDGFIGATQSLAISDATAQEIIDKLSDSLPEGRKQVVKKACSLVGKVTYFWGGKSSAIGWDSNWGKMTRVTAEGSSSTGSIRPFGLDCSGFVTWAFHNAGYSEAQIGHGAATQASKGTRISWDSAKPGDLALYNDNSHIGIIAGKDSSGNLLVIHCASGSNNVVITKKSGFGYAVRPNFY